MGEKKPAAEKEKDEKKEEKEETKKETKPEKEKQAKKTKGKKSLLMQMKQIVQHGGEPHGAKVTKQIIVQKDGKDHVQIEITATTKAGQSVTKDIILPDEKDGTLPTKFSFRVGIDGSKFPVKGDVTAKETKADKEEEKETKEENETPEAEKKEEKKEEKKTEAE